MKAMTRKKTMSVDGTLSVERGLYDMISRGDGHAIEAGFMDKSFGGRHLGAFIINTSGDRVVVNGGNYKFSAVDHEYIDDVTKNDFPFDDYVPSSATAGISASATASYDSIAGPYVSAEKDIVIGNGISAHSPVTIETGITTLSDGIIPVVKFKKGGSVIIRKNVFGDKGTTEIFDTRKAIDYGFDFTDMQTFVISPVAAGLTVCHYDYDRSITTNTDGFHTDSITCGNSSIFNVEKFTSNMVVTVSSEKDGFAHELITGDGKCVSKESHSDSINLKWNNKTLGDQFAGFPDIIASDGFEKYTWLYADSSEENEVARYGWKHYNKQKFGNHADGRSSSHDKFLVKGEDCPNCGDYPGQTLFERPSGFFDDLTNWEYKNGPLWDNPIQEAVVDQIDEIRTTNVLSSKFSINSPGNKNRLIKNETNLDAGTNIVSSRTMAADENIIYTEIADSMVNEKTEHVSGAVNTRILSMDSDRIALRKLEELKAANPKHRDYGMIAGNAIRTILNGNQEYHNYVDPDISNEYIFQGEEYANSVEFIQNGFPVNRFKFVNGTNSKMSNLKDHSEKQVDNWEYEKRFANEFTVMNGGTSSSGAPSGSGYLEFDKGINQITFQNGKYEDLTNSNVSSVFMLENGCNVLSGQNMIAAENGDMLKEGMTNVRISNWRKGRYVNSTQTGYQKVNENVKAYINIDNAGQRQGLAMSDEMNRGDNEDSAESELSSNISLYSTNDIELNSIQNIKANSRNLNFEFQTGSMLFDGSSNTSTDGLKLMANNYDIDVRNSFNTRTPYLCTESTTGEWKGTTLSILR